MVNPWSKHGHHRNPITVVILFNGRCHTNLERLVKNPSFGRHLTAHSNFIFKERLSRQVPCGQY
jgi:hypothetical protein